MNRKHNLHKIILLLIVLFILPACALPKIGADKPPEPVESISTETPNATLTEVYAMVASLIAQSSNTATDTPIPVTDTPLPTATLTNTALPPTLTATQTKIPVVGVTPIPSRDAVVSATYLSTAPTLDGVWDEWTTTQYPIKNLIFGASNWTGEDDLEGSYRVGWNSQYLFLAVKVKDDIYVQNASGANLYKGDMVELLLDTNLQGDFYYNVLSADDYQLGLSPGNPDTNGTKEAYLFFPSTLAGTKDSVIIASVSQSGLYRMEAAIPWSLFNTTPYSGAKYGFAMRISDNDNGGQNVQQSMMANIAGNVLANPTTWAELWLQ